MEADSLWGEIIPIGLAIVLYGVFQAAEVALLSVQKNRLQQWKDEGRRGAENALMVHEALEPYLTTAQILRTFWGVVAAVLAGVAAVVDVAPRLVIWWPLLAGGLASVIAVALTTLVLTYVLLLGGQLIPKAIAQQYPEYLLCGMAWLLMVLARWSRLVRALFTASMTLILWGFGQRPATDSTSITTITEETVTTMVREGAERGIFDELEHELIEGVFEFTETATREIMVPRVHIEALDVTTPPQDILRRMSDIGHSRVPVYSGDLDHIVGVLYLKDLMRVVGEGQYWELRHLLHPPLFVPETVKISLLLRTLQQQHVNLAIVIDEHGGVAGLVTIEDLVEQLVGAIGDEGSPDDDAEIVQLADGALVIEGNLPLWELRERLALPIEESSDYQTIAGLLLARLGRIPKGGETIYEHGYTFTVVDMEGPRIARVKVERRDPPEAREPFAEPSHDDQDHAIAESERPPAEG